jgi:hypothetical protein
MNDEIRMTNDESMSNYENCRASVSGPVAFRRNALQSLPSSLDIRASSFFSSVA